MKRRNFIKSLGAGVAAAMLPFGVLIQKPKVKQLPAFWYQTSRRSLCIDEGYARQMEIVMANLKACERNPNYVDTPESSKAFVHAFFFNKSIDA
jgi:hypothetical protein